MGNPGLRVAMLSILRHISNLACLLVSVPDGITEAYDKTFSMVMFCHALMLMEIVHSMLGLVKTGVMAAVLQVGGDGYQTCLGWHFTRALSRIAIPCGCCYAIVNTRLNGQ